jgi:hypothetical protein
MVEPFSPRKVLGSRTLVSATLFDYVRDATELALRWNRVTDDVARGRMRLAIDRVRRSPKPPKRIVSSNPARRRASCC